jgi:hypothetical protein
MCYKQDATTTKSLHALWMIKNNHREFVTIMDKRQ